MSESLRHHLNHRLVVDFVPLLETNALMNSKDLRPDYCTQWQDFCFECCLDHIFSNDYHFTNQKNDPLLMLISCVSSIESANLTIRSVTLGVFSKDIYAAIVHYLLECEHISIPILSTDLISRQLTVIYIMSNMKLLPNLSDGDLSVMLTSCIEISFSCAQGPWEAIFPPFTVLGGLIHLLLPQNNISEAKDDEFVMRSAKTILHTVNVIASSEVLQGHNKSTIITKLMRRYPNFMQSSLFPILFLVLVSKDKTGRTGTGVVVVETSKYQYFRRSATVDAYFCLSSSSSLLLLAHSLLPFAVLGQSLQRSEDCQLMLMIFYVYYHELCLESISDEFENSNADSQQPGAVDYIIHRKDGSLLVSNQKPDILQRQMLTSCLVTLLKAFREIFTHQISQALKIVLMNAALVVDLENTVLNVINFPEVPLGSKASHEDMIQVLSKIVFSIHGTSIVDNSSAKSRGFDHGFDNLVGVVFILDLLQLEEVSESDHPDSKEKSTDLRGQLVVRLLDDDCNYSCKLFHLFHTYTAELKKMLHDNSSTQSPSVVSLFPSKVIDYVRERVNTTYNASIADIRANRETIYHYLYPMSVMIQTLDHMAKKSCSRFFHYSIFTRSMLEVIIDSGRVVLLVSGFISSASDNLEASVSAFMCSWASLLLNLVRFSSRFDGDILAGAIRSLQFLINVGAFSPEGRCQGAVDTTVEGFPEDITHQPRRENNNIATNITYCSAVVQIVVAFLRRHDKPNLLKRKRVGGNFDDPAMNKQRLRDPVLAVGWSDYSLDDNLTWSVVYTSFLFLQAVQVQQPRSDFFAMMKSDNERLFAFIISSLELLRRVMGCHTERSTYAEDLRFLCSSRNPPTTFIDLSCGYIEYVSTLYIDAGGVLPGFQEEIASMVSCKGQLISNLLSFLSIAPENAALLLHSTKQQQQRNFNDFVMNIFSHRRFLIQLCQDVFLSVLKRKVLQILEDSIHENEADQNIIEDMSTNFSTLICHIFSLSGHDAHEQSSLLDLTVEEILHCVQIDGMLKSLCVCLLGTRRDGQKSVSISDMLSYCSDILYNRLIGNKHADMHAVCLFFSICLSPATFTTKLGGLPTTTTTTTSHSAKILFNFSSLDLALRTLSLPVVFVRYNKFLVLRWLESCLLHSGSGSSSGDGGGDVSLCPAVVTVSILAENLRELLMVKKDITIDISLAFSYWKTCSLHPDDFPRILTLFRISEAIQIPLNAIGKVDYASGQSISHLFFCVAASLLHELQLALSTISLSSFQTHIPVLSKMVKICSDMYLGYCRHVSVDVEEESVDSLLNYFCLEQLWYMLGTLHDTVVLNLPRVVETAVVCTSLLCEIVSLAHTLQLKFKKLSPHDESRIEEQRRSNVTSILKLSVSIFEHLQSAASESDDSCQSCILHIVHLFCSNILLEEAKTTSPGLIAVRAVGAETRTDWKESQSLVQRIHRLVEELHTVRYYSGSQTSTTTLLLFQYLVLKLTVIVSDTRHEHSSIAVSKFTPRCCYVVTIVWAALEEEITCRDSIAKTLMQVTCEMMYYNTPLQNRKYDVVGFMVRVYRFCILCMFSVELLNSDRCAMMMGESLPTAAILLRCLLLQCQEILLAVEQSLHILRDCLDDSVCSGSDGEKKSQQQHSRQQIALLQPLLEYLQYSAAIFAHTSVTQPHLYPSSSSSSLGRSVRTFPSTTLDDDSAYDPILTIKRALQCQNWHRIFMNSSRESASSSVDNNNSNGGESYSYIRLADANRNFKFFDVYKTFV